MRYDLLFAKVRELAHWMGMTTYRYALDKDIPKTVPYLALRSSGGKRLNLVAYNKNSQHTIFSEFGQMRIDTAIESALCAVRVTAMLHNTVKLDNYHNPIPPDLVALYSVDDANKHHLRNAVNADWWEDPTYRYLWVSLGDMPVDLWEDLSTPEDLQIDKPHRFDYVSKSLHRYDRNSNTYSFYHA